MADKVFALVEVAEQLVEDLRSARFMISVLVKRQPNNVLRVSRRELDDVSLNSSLLVMDDLQTGDVILTYVDNVRPSIQN